MVTSSNPVKSSTSTAFGAPEIFNLSLRESTRFAGRATKPEPGGKLKTAQVIRPIPGAFKRADAVGKGDRDLFKAVVTAAAKVDISFNNRASTPITLSVLDSQGKVISFGGQQLTRAVSRGTFVQSLTGVLPGTYFIRLVASSKTPSKYRIRVVTTSLSVPA